MKSYTWTVRLACVVLCAGLLAGSALAAGDTCPAWAAEAAGQWEDCGKLDSEMDYGKTLTRGELAVMVDSVLALEEATGGTISDLTGVQSTDEALGRLAEDLFELHRRDPPRIDEVAQHVARPYRRQLVGVPHQDEPAAEL